MATVALTGGTSRTLMAVRDGVVVSSQPGALPSAALEQVISAVRGLDMGEVRAKIAAEAATSAWAEGACLRVPA